MARQTVLVAAIVFQFGAVFSFQTRAASELSFADFPFMVHCEHCGMIALSTWRNHPDGVAVYISPYRQAGTVTIHGPAQPVGGDWSGSCAGKTIQQLRDAGQAFDLP